jgi:hypothetical protein
MTEPILWGSPSPWPFRGAFLGTLTNGRQYGLAWAGRVAADAPLDVAFRAGRAVDDALSEGQPTDRLRTLAAAWERVLAVDLGEFASTLSLLMTATDESGVSITGVGLSAVWAGGQGPAREWIPPGHPLLSVLGVPATRPGALSVDAAPPLLIAVAHGDPMPTFPKDPAALRIGSGVWR